MVSNYTHIKYKYERKNNCCIAATDGWDASGMGTAEGGAAFIEQPEGGI